MATTFVFRKEHAVVAPGFETVPIAEVTARRWRVSEGDRLVVTSGKGLETRFIATATVAALSVTRPPEDLARARYPRHRPDQLHLYRLNLGTWDAFPDTRTLGEMMYSLERVTNFSRPTLNVRHHARLSDADLDALTKGTIDESRSLYFGMLQHIPREWRTYLDLRSQQALAAERRDFDPASAARVLLQLLREAVGAPLDLARNLQALRLELSFNELVEAVTPASGAAWQANGLMALAARDNNATVNLLDELAEASLHVSHGETRRWRPHRW